MRIKKLLASTLALILIASSVSACASQADAKATSESSSPSAAVETDAVETEETRLEPKLPDADYEGYSFRVITKGTDNVHWKSKDIYAAEINGEAINDAVYNRNTKIGDKYNFTIEEIISSQGTWNLYADVKKSCAAASDDYDMAAMSLTTDLSNLVSAENLVDLNTVPNMDLSQPWYDSNCNSQISIAGKLFATVGDMIIMDNEATLAILFSKTLANDYQLGDLYELVRSGKWTLDKLKEYCVAVVADLDGDGKMTASDQWGVIGESFNNLAYVVASGETIVEKSAEDIPEFRLQNERYYDAVNKSVEINRNFDICMYCDNFTGYSDVWSECIDKAFSEDRALFNTAGLVRVTVFRTMENDFGILPMPKYDEIQDQYYNIVSVGCSNSIAIPITATDLDRTGTIIEALSAESMYILTPAYYDITVKGKATRDTESEEMLDLIIAHRVYELGHMFGWGGLSDTVNAQTTTGKFASAVESKMKAATKALDRTLSLFE